MTTTRLEFAPDRYPTGPGVYLFKDSRGRVLYVGKAKNLRKRLGSYFRSAAHLPLKTRLLVQGSATIDVLRTESEKEALLLEAGLIKKHRPRYNVVLRDDKEYLLFKLDKRAAYPRLTITRKVVQDGSVYFGPFASAQAARETLKILNRLFPLRKCRDATFRNRSRPCLQHDIHRCLAPCVFPVAPQEYNRLVEQVELFLAGHSARLLRALSADMKAASAKLEFERAARLRDQIQAVRKTVEQQAVVFHDTRDRDVLGLHRSEEGTALGVAFIRQGRLLDQKNYFFEPGPGSGQAGDKSRGSNEGAFAESDHETDRETVSAFLMQFYWYGRYVPDTILLPFAMDTSLLEEVVGERAGHRVRIRAARGRREKGLVTIATANAREGLLRREELRGLPGIKSFRISEYGAVPIPTTKAPLNFIISGPDPRVLDRLAEETLDRLQKVRGLADIQRSWHFDEKQVDVRVDPALASLYKTSPAAVAADLNAAVQGVPATSMRLADFLDIPIRVQYDPPARDSVNALQETYVGSAFGPVPLRALADTEMVRQRPFITRENLQPTIDITGVNQDMTIAQVTEMANRAIAGIDTPRGYSIESAGTTTNIESTQVQLRQSLLIGIVLLYLLLVVMFHSFVHPITIMAAIPLAVAGSLWGLLLFDKPMCMPANMGMIFLAGIVINNSVLLLDFIIKGKQRGMDKDEAIIESVKLRLRPILMTTFSTIVGLSPLIFEMAVGLERLSPLGIVAGSGLLVGTFLTMVVVPVVDSSLDSLSGTAREGWDRLWNTSSKSRAHTNEPSA